MKVPRSTSEPGEDGPAREEALFSAALLLLPSERAAFLDLACAGDASLRGRLQVLLQSNESAGGFLEPSSPADGPNATVPVTLPVTERPGDTIGRYKIREKLGEGGCGSVYVAEQTEPVRRRVALKILKLGMDTRSVIGRFEAERQALALMDHPNIAKVLDAGATETGRPYFVMELVRGIKITDYCDQNQCDTSQRLSLFIQVCHAIQHAHQKGVIHRDIKPSNILVTLHDGVAVPKVIDFGIAKATEGRLTDLTVYTGLHQFIGTPAYMSPEQAEMSGLDIDTRSDIYSLGVLLYELLTGRTPFDPQQLLEAGLEQMRRTIREEEPLRPSTRLSTMHNADLTALARCHRAEAPRLIHLLRGDLDWIVMKAIEKDRTRRFETASALAFDIERFLRNEAVEARPPSNLYRLEKIVRRHQTAFAAGAAVLTALVVGLGLSLDLFIKEKAALRRAVAAEQQQAAMRQKAEETLALERRLHELGPMADRWATAGFYMTQGQFDKAEELMNTVPATYRESAMMFTILGTQHARRGEWLGAMTNFSKSIQGNPTNHWTYHYLAPVLVQTGSLPTYQHYCELLLQQFSNTSDPAVAERMAKDCLLLPPEPEILQSAVKLADRAVAAGSNHDFWPYFQLVKGLAEYRRGSFADAVTWLQPVIAAGGDSARIVQAYAVLAMAQHQLKQLDAARVTLAAALQTDEQKNANLDVPNWNDLLTARLLAREARALIEPASQSAP